MQPARYFALLIAGFVWVSCLAQGTVSENKVPLSQNGELSLFLQPVPQEATELQFIIDQIVVLQNDGLRTPIPLNLHDIKGSALKGVQKQLASAVLPPGQYKGIAIRIREAAMVNEEGRVAQLVPGEDIVVEQFFDILPGKACALFLSISLPEQNRQTNRFAALFTLHPATQGVINLCGYIANARSNTITVFNKKSLQVVDLIATGQEPLDIVIDGTRIRAYVAVAGDNRVEVIDLLKREVIENLRLSLNDRPVALALTPDGRTLVAVNNGSNTISIIDALAMIEISRISVGEGPTSVVIGPSGLKAFILNTRGSNVSVIDLSQKALAVTIGLEGEPVRAAVNRDGSRLFVVAHNSPNLAVIDLTRLAVTDKVFIGADGSCITTDSQTGLIYVGLAGPAEIVVIDPFALAVIDIFHLDGRPAFLVLESQERSLFVTLPVQGQLKRIEIISKKISTGIDVGQGANTVAFVNER
jgi:YVTN family beta-propeller protein